MRPGRLPWFGTPGRATSDTGANGPGLRRDTAGAACSKPLPPRPRPPAGDRRVTIGPISAAVPVKNSSSQTYSSLRSMGRSTTSRLSSRRASSMTVSRVMPSRMFCDGGRRNQPAVAHHEDVAARAFGHMAVLGEKDGFVEAAAPRVVGGQHAVDVRAANLGAPGNRVIFHAPPGTHAGVQSVLAGQIVAERHGDDGEAHPGRRDKCRCARRTCRRAAGCRCSCGTGCAGSGASVMSHSISRGARDIDAQDAAVSSSSAGNGPPGASGRVPAAARPNSPGCLRRRPVP